MGKLYWGGGHSSILQYRGKYHFHFLICWDELQNPFVKARKMSKTHIFQTLLSGGVCEKMQKANIVAFTKTNFGGPILTFANTPFTLFAFFSSFSPCLIQLLFVFRLWGNKKASYKIFHMLDENLAEKWLSKVGYFVTALKHECPQLWHSAMTHWQVKLCCKMIWFTWKPATQVKVAEVWIALQPHLLKAPEFDANY